MRQIGRRHFVKQSAIVTSGFFLGESLFKSLLANNSTYLHSKKYTLESPNILDCLNPKYLLDDYLDEILIQAYDFELNKDNDYKAGGKQITLYCENLTINGRFENPGGTLNIFCRNLICINNATLFLNGKDARQNGAKKVSTCDGAHPNGKDADNIAPNGIKYDLDGSNAGNGNISFRSLIGRLDILANGGKGGKGEDGGDACDGNNGPNGADDKSDCYTNRPGSAGGDGVAPGINGRGANGGKGGNGGFIQVISALSIKSSQYNYSTGNFAYDFENGNIIYCETMQGKGGDAGVGGNKIAKGGSKGIGGTINRCHESGREASNCHCKISGRYPDGIDRNNEKSQIGAAGYTGQKGKTGTLTITPDYDSSFSYFPTSFVRFLLLKAEYSYINNNYSSAVNTLSWIIEIQSFFEKQNIKSTATEKFSAYLANESVTVFNQLFIYANVYLNQIRLGYDFFGNSSNYVTLLDSEFINARIDQLYKFLVDFEDLSEKVCEQSNDDKTIGILISNQKEKNNVRINNLKSNITKETDFLYSLNSEIVNRLNEITNLKKRISEKEKLFKEAVEKATRDSNCSLTNVLSVFGSIVSVASGVGAGIGIVTAGMSSLSDTTKMAGDFFKKVESVGPWFSPEKWKDIANSGGDKSIVSQINNIKGEVNDFTSNVQLFKNSFLTDKGQNKDLIALSFDETDSTLSKEKFISQMKDYIDKFNEAKEYQKEVLNYIDYCDVTNQKRLEFTNRFLQILKDQAQIDQLEYDNNSLSSAKIRNGAKSVDSKIRILFLDSYLKTKQTLLYLLYLQSKSIDYLTLNATVFDSQLYEFGIKALNEKYIVSNHARLIESLENATTRRQPGNSIDGNIFSKTGYPISFQKFIEGKVSADGKNKKHIFDFTLEPINGLYLEGEWAEIYITSSKVFIEGLFTESGSVSFTLKHFGNSKFITSKGKKIFFTHKPVLRGLTYDWKNQIYKEEFKNIIADFKLEGSKTNPYVGVSPFAHWSIEINPQVPINKGLKLDNVTKLIIKFDFYYKPFDI